MKKKHWYRPKKCFMDQALPKIQSSWTSSLVQLTI